MASNLRVDTILPSTGTTLGIGTASGSVTFLGDTDISTNGDVTIGGNLGVGVITATQSSSNIGIDLHATSSGRGSQIKFHNDHGTSFVGVSGDTEGDLLVYNQSNADVIFASNNSERLRINSSGAVMINTTNSSSRTLNLKGTFGILSANQTSVIDMSVSDAGAAVIAPYVSGGSSLELKTNASGSGVATRLTISKEGYVTTPSNVMFAANGGQSDLTNGVFVFSNVLFQRGGSNYNNSNGYFTAPVDGIYMFMCNPYRYADSNDSQISLQKSTNSGSSWSNYHEVRVYTGYGGDSGRGWVSLTMSTLMDLNKNDIVRIFAGNRCHANSVVTVYSGMLVG